MAKQTINLGTMADNKSGDPLRTAFTKVNENFTELYNRPAGSADFSSVSQDIVPDTDLAHNLGSPTKKWHSLYVGTGSIYVGDAVLSLENGKLQSSVGFAGSLTTTKDTNGIIGFLADSEEPVTTYTFPTQEYGPYTIATLEFNETGDFNERTAATWEYTLDEDGYLKTISITDPGEDYLLEGQDNRFVWMDVNNSQLEPARLIEVSSITLYDVSDWVDGTYTATATLGGQTVTVNYTVSTMENPTQFANKTVVANSMTSSGLLTAGDTSYTSLFINKDTPTVIRQSETYNDDVRFSIVSQLGSTPQFGYVVGPVTKSREFNGNYEDLVNAPVVPTIGNLKINGGTIGTADDADGWGGDDIYLAPNGEGYAWVGVPRDEGAMNGAALVIGNNHTSGGGVQIVTNGGSWNFKNNGVVQFPNNSLDGGNEGLDIKSSVGAGLYFKANQEDWEAVPTNSSESFVWADEEGAGIQTVRAANGDNLGFDHRWEFNNQGNIVLPENGDILDSEGNSVLGGASVVNPLYIIANTDGNISTSIDGADWSSTIDTGINIGTVAVGPDKIVYTRSDVNGDNNNTGLYSSKRPTLAPTLIEGTDGNPGGDLYWLNVEYFPGAPYPWVAVGYQDAGTKRPVLMYSSNAVNWTHADINLESAYDTSNLEFTDVAYGNGYYVITARSDANPGGMWFAQDLSQTISVSTNQLGIEANFKFIEYFSEDGGVNKWNAVAIDKQWWATSNPDPTVSEGWSNYFNEQGLAGMIQSETGLSNQTIEEFTSGQINGMAYWMASSGNGHIVWWPNAPVGPFVSIPQPYTATVTGITDSPTAVISFTGTDEDATGEKFTISGSSVEAYNGTYYIGAGGGMFTDAELTIPFDASVLEFEFTGTATLTWSHGEYIDSLGYANNAFYAANDNEQIFKGQMGEGLYWTKVDDKNNSLTYWNDFAYFPEFTYNSLNTGNITFEDNKIIGGAGLQKAGVIQLVPVKVSDDNWNFEDFGQFINIYPTNVYDVPHIHIAAGVGSESEGDLFLGDDNKFVQVDHYGVVKVQSHNLDTSESHMWTFGNNGNLQLPAGGGIVDSNGSSVLGGGGVTSYNDLTDKPTIPDLTGYATESYVGTAISNLVDSAPSTLNTLNEIAAALNDDASFASTITTSLGNKADTSSLATVATSGSYSDLTNKPTLFDGAYSSLSGKPTLFDGAYSSLSGKPTLFSGSYSDLTNKPTNITTFYNNANYQTAADVMTLTTNMGFQTQTQVANAITAAITASQGGDGTPTTTYTATATHFGGFAGTTLSGISVAGTMYYSAQFNTAAVTITNVGSDYTISVDSTTLNNSQMLQEIQSLTVGQTFNPWYDGNTLQLSLNLATGFVAGSGSSGSTTAPTFTVEKSAYMTAGVNPPGITFYSNDTTSGTMTLYGGSFDSGVPTQIKDAILALGESGTFKITGPLASGSGDTTVTLASGWADIGGGNYSASYMSNNAISDQQTIWSVTAALPVTAATTYYGAPVPSTSAGVTGDKAGYIASDSSYLYICVRDYDGNPNAWKRILIDPMGW